MKRAADVLVDTMVGHGVDRVFCVPGESYLSVLDAMHGRNEVQVVACRHEGGAGFMAVADAKLTGGTGVAMVSRGPGACNASIAVHTSQQDAVPFVLFIGQVPRADLGRGAFQEVDYSVTFGDMAKFIEEVHDPERLPAAVAEAFKAANEGTPGPSVIVLPEDMLMDEIEGAAAEPLAIDPPKATDEQIKAVAAALGRAKKPLIIAGTLLRPDSAREALLACSKVWSLPVATSFKNQDLFPNDHDHFAAHLGYGVPASIRETLEDADLIVAVGTRLGDVVTQGYLLPLAPQPKQPLIHVYPDAEHLDHVFETAQAICADPEDFLLRLAGVKPDTVPQGRGEWLKRLRDAHRKLSEWKPWTAPDGVDFGRVIHAFTEQLGDDAVFTMDAGNFSSWLHRYYSFKPTHQMLGAVSGAMGMGVPSGVAAALRHPDRQVVTLCGDGGTLMTGNELATAVQYGAKVRVFVSNNRSYGTIRLHQEKTFPGRVEATDLKNPDFAAWAESFGAKGLTIRTPEETEKVVAEALAHDGPVVVDVHSSLEHISAYTNLTSLKPGAAK
ncbi:MAG: acetolactate synthase [Rhodospirillaceae bacterium]|nr:acetolactate synthase [Rhodospirillaceae bacterium]